MVVKRDVFMTCSHFDRPLKLVIELTGIIVVSTRHIIDGVHK